MQRAGYAAALAGQAVYSNLAGGKTWYGGSRNGRSNGHARPSNTMSRSRKNGTRRTGGYGGRFSGSRGAAGRFHQEMKFLDYTADTSVTAEGWTITNNAIPIIPNGPGENERIGRKAVIRKIQLRYQVYGWDVGSSTVLLEGAVVRVVLYLDTQCNGAAATAAQIWQTTTDVSTFINMENSQRFKILYNKTHTLNPAVAGWDGAAKLTTLNRVQGKCFKKCAITIDYDDTGTGLLAEMKSNNIGLMFFKDTGTIGALRFEPTIRLRYTDA